MKSITNIINKSIAEDAVMDVMRQVERYRITTFDAAQQLACFEGQGPRSVKAVLKECVHRGWLGNAWLDASRRYWFLRPHGAEVLKLTDRRTGPLSEGKAKIGAATMLFFCLLGDRDRQVLTPAEAHSYLGCDHGTPSTYYFDETGNGCLGLARIDVGRLGRWDRIVRSVRDDVGRHLDMVGVKRLLAKRQFELTIITAIPQKAERLSKSINEYPELKRIPVKVVACPGLLPLLATAPKKKGR